MIPNTIAAMIEKMAYEVYSAIAGPLILKVGIPITIINIKNNANMNKIKL